MKKKRTHLPYRRYKRLRFNPRVGKIPWRRAWQWLQYSCLENPVDRGRGGLQSMGSQRVRHDWSHLARRPSRWHLNNKYLLQSREGILKDILAVSYKSKHALSIQPSNHTPRYLKSIHVRSYTRMFVYSSFIHRCQKLEASKKFFTR